MKKTSLFLLFVLLTLVAEDFFYGHAAAEDITSSSQILAQTPNTNSPMPSSPASDSEQGEHRASHFGHCSFLLIESCFLKLTSKPPVITYFHYFFSLKLANTRKLLRPPILRA